jgi:hypothetical protein
LPPEWDRDRVFSTNELELANIPARERDLVVTWRSADMAAREAQRSQEYVAGKQAEEARRVEAGLPSEEEMNKATAQAMGQQTYDPVMQSELYVSSQIAA